MCRLKNPMVISIWLLVGFHPANRSVQSTPADNTRKRVWQYIEKASLQRLSADDTSRHHVRWIMIFNTSAGGNLVCGSYCSVTLHAGKFVNKFLSSTDFFFQKLTFSKFFHEYHQGVKKFGPRSDLVFCQT